MEELKYPIGMQTFSNLIEKGYVYVDKTKYIKPLLNQGKFVFLSRPRRFGKSLLLSTLKSYFEGRRELFKGLAADSMDLDWTPSPVFRFDLNAEDFRREDAVELLIEGYLRSYERIYGRDPHDITISQRFKALIENAYRQTGKEVVILVDEYDKPLLEVEEDRHLFDNHQRALKSFFGNLKSMDEYIRFVFITGVARFNRVSIFSDFNNLKDISLADEYADICGWSENELVGYFRSGIEGLARKRKENFQATLKALRDYYDGYLFAQGGSRLYNPYSVLNALDLKEIDTYWFGTGTPTFLARRIKANRTFPPDINGKTCTRKELTAVGLNDINPLPLMFQTGYLTIWKYREDEGLYELRFPNHEVELAFYEDLLPIYIPETADPFSPFSFHEFRKDLAEGRPKDFMERMSTLLKDLPVEDHNESVYRASTFLLTVLSGTPTLAEHHGYKGRSDLEVFAGKYIYILEFKYNRSVQEAMAQIHSRDYAGRYALDSRTVYLIGVNYEEKKDDRGLKYEIETYKS